MQSTTSRSVTSLLLVPLLLLLMVVGSAAAKPASANASEAVVKLAHIEGSGNQTTGRWQLFDVTVPHDTTITATANWSSSANVNIFLYDASGQLVAKANSLTARPETLDYEAKAGDYELAVLVKTGSASYEVDVLGQAAGPLAVIEGSGDQKSGRWQRFPIAVDHASTLEFVADWTGGGNVNLILRDEDRNVLTRADNKRRKPETMTYEADAGIFELVVYIRRGSAAYRVEVTATPPGPQDDPQHPTPGDDPIDDAPFKPAYAGQPAPGSVLWGAGVGGNDDPVARHESPAGTTMPLRRTFFQWRHRTGYMVDMARDDLAAGRLPWVSTKTPGWSAMARGDHDAEIDQMLRALDELDGPVWLTIHHEPEGGAGINRPDDPAGPAAHVAMNRRVRQRIDALGVDNVALAQVLMSYTWMDASGRNPDDWYAPGIYDIIGIDHYVEKEVTLVDDTWDEIRRWAAARNTDIAVGEWGMRGTDHAAGVRVREWYEAAADSHDDDGGARVVGIAAFDSGLNAPTGSWELRGEQLRMFHQLMADPRSARVSAP